MVRTNRILASALLVVALAANSAVAHAWPLSHLFHLHPTAAQAQDARITVQLSNRSGLVQQVKVGERVYTLMPNSGLSVTAPEGTQIVASSNGFKHRAGDKLCVLTRETNLETVVID